MNIEDLPIAEINVERYRCPYCGGTGKFFKSGREFKEHKTYIRIRCGHCRKRFYKEKLLPPKISNDEEIELNEDKGEFFERTEGNDNKFEIEESEESFTINCRHLDIQTVEDAIKQSKVDLEKWEIYQKKVSYNEVSMRLRRYKRIEARNNEGEYVYIYQRVNDKPITVTNANITVKFKPRLKFFDPEKMKRDIFNDLKKYKTKVNKYKYPKILKKEKHLFFYSLNDLHLARQAWREETGIDYDIKIARNNYLAGENHILSYVLPFTIDHICFGVGNDLFNYDYSKPYPHTEAGTPQEADTRWQKMFRLGYNLVIEAAVRLSKIAPLTIIVIRGNHDSQTIFYLGEMLELFFEGNNNVHVDNRPPRRKYFKYGNNLLGFSHGNKEKPKDLHAIMSSEADSYLGEKSWSETDFRYFYMGHKHHEEVHRHKVIEDLGNFKGVKLLHEIASEDYKGVLVDYLPNLAFRHDYEVDYGWIGTIRSAKAALHHQELGRVINFNYNISENKVRSNQE